MQVYLYFDWLTMTFLVERIEVVSDIGHRIPKEDRVYSLLMTNSIYQRSME
jgi:hypothetical protein